MQKLRNFFKSITLEKETNLRESVLKAVKTHTKESIEYLIESIQWLSNLKIPTEEKESFINECTGSNFVSTHYNILELLKTLKSHLCEIILELF